MTRLRYTARAKLDLANIAAFTLAKWGEEQVIRYLDQLETACAHLETTPMIGRDCSNLHPDLRRIECGSHIIFYLTQTRGVRILRILHEKGCLAPETFAPKRLL